LYGIHETEKHDMLISNDLCESNLSEKDTDINCSEESLKTYLHEHIYLSCSPSNDDEHDVASVTNDDAYLSDLPEDCFEDAVDDFDEEVSSRQETYIDNENEPLYPGANVTLGAFMLLLALFCTKHNIVGEGIQQLLNIIALVLPNEHNLSTSLHSYKMFFKNLKNPLKKHYYCKHCLSYIDDEHSTLCANAHCGKMFDCSTGNYFLEMPVLNQVKNLFAQDGFFESLGHRFRHESAKGHYHDIYDGQLYKSYCENDGPLSKQENISFVGNTDGAPVFKSSNVSIWPIFLIVNELPYKLRMRKENMILAALWFGIKKPVMSTFLKPLSESLKQMAAGIKCYSPKIGYFISKGYLMCFTADLPARCLICNCNQYNGSYSCWKCLQQGATAKSGKGHTHIFPYLDAEPKGPKRTAHSVFVDATTAVNERLKGKSNAVAHGIKGPSWFILFPKFNIIDGVAIDYMHGVLLGVQKRLLHLWFAQEFAKERFSFSKLVGEADSKLKMMRPTLEITRLPRSIQNELKYWKASEFRSFLLFYGAIVMFGILDDERLSHYLLFVHAIHILLKSGSNEADIDYSEQMLFKFCKEFASLYHERFMTLNMHQLVHLPDSVRQLGPLYTHSCFSFEDKNGVILKMIRGTQCIDNQITTGISFVQKIPELKQKCIPKHSKLELLCDSIENPYVLKRTLRLDDNTYALGSVKEKLLLAEEQFAVSEYLQEAIQRDTYCTFNRIEIRNAVVYGTAYKRMSKRDNSTVCFYNQDAMNFGRVRFFIRLHEHETVALIEVLNCENFDNRNSILAVTVTNKLKIVCLKNIRGSCLFLSSDKSGKQGYVCQFPNRKESD